MNSQYSSANIFSDVKVESFPRHKFNLSYTNTFSANHGWLIPSFIDENIPGDLVDVKSYGRVQLTPLATSSLQNIKCYERFFYIPYRLVWKKWDEFISQVDFDNSPLLAPYATLSGDEMNFLMRSGDSNKLLDFLGVGFDNRDENGQPIDYNVDAKVSFTLFRLFSYWLIWDTYFRDENLQNPVFNIDDVLSGENDLSTNRYFNEFLPVAKEKDYFTTALPWTQKGNPVTLGSDIVIPQMPLVWKYGPNKENSVGFSQIVRSRNHLLTDESGAADLVYQQGNFIGQNGEPDPQQPYIKTISGVGTLHNPTTELLQGMNVELTPYTADSIQTGTTISINEIRYANALQRYLERLALGGSRPAEFYLSMYGVNVDDLRIGQPKYLGGGYSYVHISSIAQTAQSEDSPLATLAGNGEAGCKFEFNEPFYAQEFGIVMGVFYIRPELNYTQGLPRILQAFSHLDYYNPVFAHLGEEEVRTSELFLKRSINNNPSTPEFNNDDTFGYQSRYAYLKEKRNELHGEMKTSLSDWVLSSHFVQKPSLNSTFITQPQNYDIFSVLDDVTDHYIVELRHEYEKVSSMPDFAIPSL